MAQDNIMTKMLLERAAKEGRKDARQMKLRRTVYDQPHVQKAYDDAYDSYQADDISDLMEACNL